MTENPNTDEWEEYTRKEVLAAVNETIVDANSHEDGFRAGMEHGALSVLERLTGEEWVRHWVTEELEEDDDDGPPLEPGTGHS